MRGFQLSEDSTVSPGLSWYVALVRALLVRQHLLLGEVCLQPSLIIRTAADETASGNEIHNELACFSTSLA